MNNVDKQYLSLLEEIVRFGVEKDTRAGRVKSIFGKQLRFDLKEGFPLLTTKKVFTKGVIHELLWFLQRPYNSHGSVGSNIFTMFYLNITAGINPSSKSTDVMASSLACSLRQRSSSSFRNCASASSLCFPCGKLLFYL